jgi:nifR3 family TIM-barrel protein
MTVAGAPALVIGPYSVWPPVVLAPMAGVTNAPFRTLCREFGAGLFVSEMITARAVVERNPRTAQMIAFSPGESPRSIQLYGTDPTTIAEATARLIGDDLADHIDLNFGCPAPKVTRRGGGAALTARPALVGAIVAAAVRAAAPAPVTVKFRLGIDDEHLTYLDVGRAAADAGAVAIALHARTAEQHYAGPARWRAIAALKAHVGTVPVLGNGDIWAADDAVAMMAATGCDGVVVGRGCLGRPWLFADLARVFAGGVAAPAPRLGEAANVLRRHGALLADWFGEAHGMRELRKHTSWYLKGYVVGAEVRRQLALVSSLGELDALLALLEPDQSLPAGAERLARGHTNGPIRVALPEGWLDDPTCAPPPLLDDVVAVSGG